MSRPASPSTGQGLPATGGAAATPAAGTRLRRPSWSLLVWLVLLAAGLVAGLVAWGYQLRDGMTLTNMRNLGVWGLYISFFMFFVGLAGGAMILAFSGRLFRVERLAPVMRPALLQASVGVLVAMLFLLPDIGRPDRLWNMLVHPNLSSPMVWDFYIVVICLVISLIATWAYARADVAGRGKSVLAGVGLPAGVLLISIDAWIFGLQNSRGFWYSAIMAPLFISSGLVSATALVILLCLVMRRLGRVTVANHTVTFVAGLLAVFVAVEAFLVFAEMLTAAYPGAGFEADPVARLLTGRYSPIFWFEIAAGLVVPFVLLVVPRWRARTSWVAVASALALVGVLAHRLTIVMNGLSEASVAYSPGAPIGTAQPSGTGSFALSLVYYPSVVEWLVSLGLICLGALVFTVLTLALPLHETGCRPSRHPGT